MNFGLLANTSRQLEMLERAVLTAGQSVSLKLQTLSKNIDEVSRGDVDAWFVQINMQDDGVGQRFIEALDNQSKPVIFDDIESFKAVNSGQSAKRLAKKISESLQALQNVTVKQNKATEVWVLAASAGGPDAVAEFLSALPSSMGIGHRVAFLYAQHINLGYTGSLKTLVQRNCSLQVFESTTPQLLRSGCLYIVSPAHQIELHETGWMTPVQEPWPGDYSPSLDQVIAKVARRYGRNSGAIIFSGMGNDGSGSCGFMKHSGGNVWAQEPASCAVDSMPKEAIGSKVVGFVAEPAQLAMKFDERHRMAID